MFEGVVAAVLNRFLGKYVQDLDTENLNVGIFGGDVQLHDLRLKPEALYELDLPIEVKAGTIGRVALNIPWSGLYTQSVVVTIEDVYVIVGPAVQGPYNAQREKRLLRAAKKRRLDALESTDWLSNGLPDNSSFFENLVTTVMNNLQVFVRNVHFRYEDTVTSPGSVLACGVCVSSISVEFTNNKWKPCASSPGATSVYQLIRLEAFSLYWNPRSRAIIGDQDPEDVPFHVWREDMERGLQTFCVGGDPFNFMVKPVSAKVKVIVNRSNEARVPKLLVDFVVEDIPTQLTRAQFLSMEALCESVKRFSVSRKFRHRHPGPGPGGQGSRVRGNVAAWWRYACQSLLDQRVRPYTWPSVKRHRQVYARYRDTYRLALLTPSDTELRIDLQQLEDQLDVVDIVIAREQAKVELHKQDPERVTVGSRTPSWWEQLVRPSRTPKSAEDVPEDSRSPSPELQVRTEKARGLWTQLSLGERDRLYEAIGYAEGVHRPEKPKQYIEHKLNITLVNCSLSLVARDKEILVITLTHFLGSLETRPSAGAYKASVRAESLVIEGASIEHDLVPLATANMNSGNNYANFLAIDFEKNPIKTEADFGINVIMEPMEVVYHEHAVSELLSFFSTRPLTLKEMAGSASTCARRLREVGEAVGRRALSRRTTYCINMDIRVPYLVIPESGSMQKGGQVLVLDLGRVVVRSELQPAGVSLEDATQMELEERLYDRLHIECSETQVLFCDSGDEWWESRKMQDSELHLIPKVRCQVVFSNSVRPEYRQLAAHKLTVSLSSLKLNLSDRRIGLALDFIDNVPAPSPNTIRVDPSSSELDLVDAGDGEPGRTPPSPNPAVLLADRVPGDMDDGQLDSLRRTVSRAAVRIVLGGAGRNRAAAKVAVPEVDRSFMSSDQSDSEDMELWARTVDLPGFDDNVSPHNAITMLLRFVIGELVINLARSSNRVDKPYLLLRVGKLCWDSALMEYGPAVQASVGSVQLVDRLHPQPGNSGQYLEMISTSAGAGAGAGPSDEVLSLLYRKVRSNCPDFRSHFHNVEQSLVVDVATVNLVFHQEAFITLHKYLQYIAHKVQSRETMLTPLLARVSLDALAPLLSSLWRGPDDPPIPQGATKFSYSTTLGEVRLRLCDTDLEFLEMRLGGLESDCLFKANERMVLRTHLTSLSCDDLSDATLYHKVLAVEDDRAGVLDLKYVRHAPRLYKHTELDTNADDVKSDGSVKLRLGRLSLVLLYKMAVDLQHFVEPVMRPGLLPHWVAVVCRLLERGAGRLRSWPTRLHVSLDLHMPSLLLPQKSGSPNLLVLNLGDLTVENFFKELTAPYFQPGSGEADDPASRLPPPVIDNVLVRLDNAQVCRAVMTLAGALHVQEPILEPMSLRLDAKRWVAPRPSPCATMRDLLLYDVSGGMDMVRVNLGQRDLATLLAVWTDNLAEGRFMDISESHPASPMDPGSPSHHVEDQTARKLQAFFCQNEQVRRESSVRLSLDGVQVALFNDMDEILSSPVRDLNHGLCRMELGEATLTLDTYTDRSLELRTSLLTCVLEDIRPEHPVGLKKIFQSHAGLTHTDSSAISVSTPPIVDLTFRQSHAGDRCIDILVEQTRLNLSVGFLAAMARFMLDALPGERYVDGGFINQGYVGDLNVHQKGPPDGLKTSQRPPSSADSTSGYFSSRASCADDQAGLSVSLQLRKPEVLLVAEPLDVQGVAAAPYSNSLLLRTEVLLDFSRHPGRESLVCSLAGLQVLAMPAGGPHGGPHGKRLPQQVLYPCDIEFAKSLKSTEEGVRITGSVSAVDIRLCASTVHTILDVLEDVNAAVQTDELDPTMFCGPITCDAEDLWSPKKTQPYIFPDGCDGLLYHGGHYPLRNYMTETIALSLPKVRVVFELESAGERVPVLLIRAAADACVQDWSRQMHLKGEVQLQASYYNGELGAWEPLVEPVVEEENVFRPWELQVKVFQAQSFPIASRLDCPNMTEAEVSRGQYKRASMNQPPADDSQTSGDETEPEHTMTFIRRPRSDCGGGGGGGGGVTNRRNQESVSMIGYPDDSDSENEEGVMEKLASAIGHLFTGDSSDGEASESESDESSIAEPSASGATEEASEMETVSAGGSTIVGNQERAVFLKKYSDSVDSGLEEEGTTHRNRNALYVVLNAKDRLELTVTPAALNVLGDLNSSFTRQDVAAMVGAGPVLKLENKLGPGSTVILTSKAEKGPDGKDVVLAKAVFDAESTPSSPGTPKKTITSLHDISPTESEMDIDNFEGGYTRVFEYGSEASQAGQELFSPLMKFPQENASRLYNKITDHRLTVKMDGFDPLQVLCPQRSAHKVHGLVPARHNVRYHVVLDVESTYQHRRLTMRSPLQVRNETVYAMGLYYKKAVLDGLGVPHIGESTNPFENTIRVAIIEPDETFNVPLYITYHCKLFLLPAYVDSYHVSETGLWWKELAADMNTPRDIYCPAKEEKDPTVFSMRAVCSEGVPVKQTSRSIPNYVLRLLPPLRLHNRLPYAVEVKIPAIKYEVRIEAGEKASVYFLNLLKMHKITVDVPNYLGLPWTGCFSLTADLEEKTILMATEHDTEGGNKQLGLSLKVDRGSACDVYLHAPYWVINKTGLPLQIRGSLSDVVYEATGDEPLLFCYRKHKRRCVRLRAYHSSWSSAFSLDTVGTAGLVVCRDRERKRHYRILLSVTLSQVCPQLTKIVTLLPNFVVSNESKKHLRFMEENERADLWTDLAPGQTLSFWPMTDSMRMYVKYRDSKLVSQHFPITQTHRTVLRMDRGGGLCVDVTGGGDLPFSVSFRGYTIGDAPVRVDNLCEDLFLKIHQQDLGQVALLSPYQSMLYTWDDPSRERSLLWNVYNKKCKGFVADFWKDGYGQERVCFHSVRQPPGSNNAHAAQPAGCGAAPGAGATVTAKLSAGLKLLSPRSATQDGSSSSDDTESDELLRPHKLKRTRRDKVVVYWVSFLEGYQRVLLFTQDERVAMQARRRLHSERTNTEYFLSLSGVGVSLVSRASTATCPVRELELAYLSLSDSAAVWEVSVAHRWKPLTLELASWIEDKWRQEHKKAQMKDFVHVDFDKMHMTKPFYGELRRRYSPAFWLQVRRADHHSLWRMRVHKLQIDNQLPTAHFPTVLCPAPVPTHVARRSGVKPCLELLVLKRHRPAYNQDVYKYVKLLVQEFCLQLDRAFLDALFNSWATETRGAAGGPKAVRVRAEENNKPAMGLRADLAVVHQPLNSLSYKEKDGVVKSVVEYLHLSPIRLRLSICPRGSGSGRADRNLGCDMLDYVLNALVPSLTEIKNVRLKMAYFERKGVLATEWEVCVDAMRHYYSQLIQQVHVMVLGLDVLGNPYGLVADFTDGFGEFFYEPFLGTVESPDEFSEGLALGAQALLGHVTGAGGSALALLAPSLGGILPSLSSGSDDDYKKKRRFCLQQATDLPEQACAASRTFAVGVLLGLSGVVLKPTLGAPQEGAEGFFRGTGKGLLGLMTKPSGGVVDCIAMAHDGIKRAVELGEDVMLRERLPRYLNPYQGVKPFSTYQATGQQLLHSLSRGHYVDSDVYWAHAALGREGKSTLLITLQHVFLLERCRQWGPCDVEWFVRVDDIMAVPLVDGSGRKLLFKVRQDESYSAFSGDERSVSSDDPSVLSWLREKVEAVLVLNMEDKPVLAST